MRKPEGDMVTRTVVSLSLVVITACPPHEPVTSEVASATAPESTSSSSADIDSTSTESTTGDDASTTEIPEGTTFGTSTAEPTTTDDEPAPFCGDGKLNPGEECDEGNQNDNAGSCTEFCDLPACGDGFLQRGEECDLGEANDNQGKCTKACALATCGDEFVQEGEACDDGKGNNADKNGGCHPETCQIVSTCLDGELQPDEECDKSAGGDLALVCTDQCYIENKVIFATSEVYAPNFPGIAQADGACKTLAKAADLANPGSFVAWLSSSNNPIEARISHLPFKYVRTDTAKIANSWSELVDGTLEAPISKDEHGNDATQNSPLAWTGTLQDGTEATQTCLGWTKSGPPYTAIVGSLTAIDGTWTHAIEFPCSQKVHLYCVEG